MRKAFTWAWELGKMRFPLWMGCKRALNEFNNGKEASSNKKNNLMRLCYLHGILTKIWF
jgi:predicted Fe-S protein YdhL (DUF1289 family)